MNAAALAHGAQPREDAATHLGNFKFLSVGRSDAGCVRRLNEDAFLDRPEIGLWAVADGMGGHEGGDVASRMVVDALRQVSSFSSAYAFRNGVSRALQDVNAKLLERAAERGVGMMGSTVVSLLVHSGHYACVWAGDSRAYLLRHGVLRAVTRDHSYVQCLIDKGQLSREEARGHASAHVITRAVGAGKTLELESAHGQLRAGDRFVLCSDGLTGMLLDQEIAKLLQRPPLEAALQKMLDRALSRGAPDNVTIMLIGIERGSNPAHR